MAEILVDLDIYRAHIEARSDPSLSRYAPDWHSLANCAGEDALRRAEEERDGWRDGSVVALRRIDSLETALREIADWKLPGKPDVYECRDIARRALNPNPTSSDGAETP